MPLTPKPYNLLQRPRQRGFTLIELLVTIAILAILISLATPSFSRQLAEIRRTNAVSALSKSFSVARSQAIKGTRPVYLCISIDETTCASGSDANGDWSKGWLLYSDVNNNGDFNSGTDTVVQTQAALKGLTSALSTATTPKSSYGFLANGLLKGGADTIEIKPSTSGVSSKFLKLNSLGRVSLADTAT